MRQNRCSTRLAGVVLGVAALLGTAAAVAAQGRNIGVQNAPSSATVGIYGDSWAVVIGINDYQHPRIPKLRYAVNDARAVEQALLGQGFRRDRVIT
ncbi:MAG: caspase family protein, partial [Candidatus Rokubacteria bacterium]|nr:caspase family protein [Candidatus Rokubacteria bacterium]